MRRASVARLRAHNTRRSVRSAVEISSASAVMHRQERENQRSGPRRLHTFGAHCAGAARSDARRREIGAIRSN